MIDLLYTFPLEAFLMSCTDDYQEALRHQYRRKPWTPEEGESTFWDDFNNYIRQINGGRWI